MPWYHIACMPGMDWLAEDLLCLYVRLWGGYGDTDQGSWPSLIKKFRQGLLGAPAATGSRENKQVPLLAAT